MPSKIAFSMPPKLVSTKALLQIRGPRMGGVGSVVVGFGVLGAPRFSVRSLKMLALNDFGTSGLKIGAPQKPPNPTTTDPTPHSRPSHKRHDYRRQGRRAGGPNERVVVVVKLFFSYSPPPGFIPHHHRPPSQRVDFESFSVIFESISSRF